MTTRKLFTSESVAEGHPDKMADQISDAILDAILAQEPESRVACETLIKTGFVLVSGEITTNAWVDLEALVRQVVCDIGYDHSDKGFDGKSCGVLNAIGKQSSDISQGISRGLSKRDQRKQGAGDQGMMFGYAANETDVLMPLPITLAHRLVKRQSEVRKKGKLPWLRPDAKSQVTVVYEDDRPVGLDAVVLSTQHAPGIKQKARREAGIEEILKPVIGKKWFASLRQDKIHINPTGSFVIGGDITAYNGTARSNIVRISSTGALDASYHPGGVGVDNDVFDIAIQGDGKAVVVGSFIYAGNVLKHGVVRLLTSGDVDGTFSNFSDPGIGTETNVMRVAITSTGRVLIGGWFSWERV